MTRAREGINTLVGSDNMQLAAWAEVRGIGKREALRRLELLEG